VLPASRTCTTGTINPSAWGHLNFELNCAVVYSKYCSFINSGWISMELETEYLGMSIFLNMQ
jgi:hypothetical protein